MPIRFANKKLYIGAVIFLLLFFFLIRAYFTQSILPNRIGVVVVGSPYRVILWDRMRGIFTSFILPEDALIDVVHGYGRLPMRSLQALDHMEKQHGHLIRESVSDAVGFPIDFHIVPEGKEEGDEERAVLRHIFSLGRIFSILVGHGETNIGWTLYVSLSRAASIVSNQSVLQFFTDTPGVVIDTLDSSGAPVRNFSTQAFDSRVGARFEDPDIASERLSVSLFNATDIPGLAGKAVRLMEKSGVHVVSIGNREEDAKDLCAIETGKELLNTNTVHFIQRTLGCTTREIPGDGQQSDIQVILYTPWADRYLPVKK